MGYNIVRITRTAMVVGDQGNFSEQTVGAVVAGFTTVPVNCLGGSGVLVGGNRLALSGGWEIFEESLDDFVDIVESYRDEEGWVVRFRSLAQRDREVKVSVICAILPERP